MMVWTGWEFFVNAAGINEDPLPGEHPAAYVTRLAAQKARAVANQRPDGGFILAADTTVADNGQILGKPANAAEARRMLVGLRGRIHQVYTALALLDTRSGVLRQDACVSLVAMRNYSDEEIERYILSGDPFDKAGGYAIQHAGFQPVEGFGGCIASVMGFPLCHLTRLARQFALTPPQDAARACQSNLEYACPVSAAVLRGEDAG
jgi:MAF protein